jgi:hypothetical protein
MVRQQIAMPPRHLLGRFTRPGDCEAIAEWLCSIPHRSLTPPPNLERGRGAEAVLRFAISLDMLCYGGLVASRTLSADLATAAARLEALRDLRRRLPGAVIFAFSAIMRLGATVTCAADLNDHLLLRSYSQLLDRVERLGDRQANRELDETRRQLDPDHLAEYLAIRRRNHAVNRMAVQLVAEGVLDYLVLAQEDAAPVGIHLPEQLALRAQIEEYRVADRAVLTCGADEMTAMLLARHVVDASGMIPGIAVDYAAEAGSAVVPAFESQPVRDTVLDHLAIAGARAAIPADADALLFVHTPIGAQADIAQAPPPGQAPSLALQAESISDRVGAAAAAGRLLGLADIAYCNGADPELIGALERQRALAQLGAFGGWNTAANTLGTVISQLCLMAARGRMVKGELARRFLTARLVDDYGYQTCTRRRAVGHAEEIGADPFDLGEARAELESFVNGELEPLAHRYVSQVLAGLDAGPVRLSLPWGRLFEVEVELEVASSLAEPKNRR